MSEQKESMTTHELEERAVQQSNGYPMPTEDRINAALWYIAWQLSRIADKLEAAANGDSAKRS